MQLSHRSFLLGICSLVLLCGCEFSSPWGSSSTGSDYGSAAATGGTGSGTGGSGTGDGGGTGTVGVGGESGITGTDDTVVATPSVAGVVVAVGASQTISISVHLERRTRDHGLRDLGHSGNTSRRLERARHLHVRIGHCRQRLRSESDLRSDSAR